MTGGQNSVKRSSRMINSHDKQVDIIKNNLGIIISVSKRYEGKLFPFSVICNLPISFDYSKDSYIHLSFTINTPENTYNFIEGELDKTNPYTSYTVVLKSSYAEIVNLVTPKNLRNNGFASAILDIVSEIIIEYNNLIKRQKIQELKDYSIISFITGFAKSCDEEPKLNDEQLSKFYQRHGFEIDSKRNIMKVIK